MPELPEVQTTVSGLKKHIIGLTVKDIWSNYSSKYFHGSETIKDPAYFKIFKKKIIGQKIISVSRRAKNILIHLSNDSTILIHMKMTGHLLYGKYNFNPKNKKDPWQAVEPQSLKDPFNRFVHIVFTLSNNKHLALSDVRRFAKITLIQDLPLHLSKHLNTLGPEPLEKDFTFDKFQKQLLSRPRGKIKQVLMDQNVLAGIGNIYADESLWRAGINPIQRVTDISPDKLKKLFIAIKQTLSKGINLGGDSMSDYRNIMGEKGKFQEHHRAYKKTGTKCMKPRCDGTITRIVLGGRGTHFCDKHQKLC